MSSPTPDRSVTVPDIRARKRSLGAAPIVMLTAYDEPSARLVSAGGVDVLLVGDSLGNVVLGYDDTLQVTVDDIVHHTGAVARAHPRALLVADMPWMSYHRSTDEAVGNASRMIRAGAEAVKLEGGRRRLAVIDALLHAEIPVMGHLGLTPQSVHAMGGYKVQGKDGESARVLLEDARLLAEAGCFSLVLEGVPDVLADAVTTAIDIPTIGIGAGAGCDGQVLVFHDLLGLGARKPPKFVRQYADLGAVAISAISAFAEDVRAGRFPNDEESYHAPAELGAQLGAARPAT